MSDVECARERWSEKPSESIGSANITGFTLVLFSDNVCWFSLVGKDESIIITGFTLVIEDVDGSMGSAS